MQTQGQRCRVEYRELIIIIAGCVGPPELNPEREINPMIRLVAMHDNGSSIPETALGYQGKSVLNWTNNIQRIYLYRCGWIA